MAKDPICYGEYDPPKSQRFNSLIFAPGMEVDEEATDLKVEYKGKIYYFCAPGCKAQFEEDPEKYL